MHPIAAQKREACVVFCGDTLIFDQNVWEWNRRFGKGRWWPVLVLGGVKKLRSPEKEDRGAVIREIQGRYGIAPFGLIILENHTHCIAYARSGFSFGDPKDEEAFHAEELNKAREVIKQAFPDLAVECHYFLKEEQRLAW